MGMFDTYFSEKPTKENYDTIIQIQLKNGPCIMKDYWPGCDADIPDDVYVSYDGIVVIADRKVSLVTNVFTDKWGNRYQVAPEFESALWKILKDCK